MNPTETPVAECRPSANPKKQRAGIGMPATLHLEQYADILYQAFDEMPYQVGSSVTAPTWRDVDIRIMLDADRYAAMGFGDPRAPHHNAKWCAYVLAFSELGRRMTGLPIDFQIQELTQANSEYPEDGRSALCLLRARRGNEKQRQEQGVQTVLEIIQEAAQKLGKDAVFHYPELKKQAFADHPDDRERIRQGIYTASATLLKKKNFVKVPGGFKLAPV